MRHSLLISMLLFPLSLFAQTFWVNLGAGYGTVFDESIPLQDEQGGSGFEVSVNMSTFPNQLITLRATSVNASVFYLYPDGSEGMQGQDIGLLYGFMYKNDDFLGSLSAGLASTVVDNYSLLGYPLESQIFWTPHKNIGLGLIGIANVNPEKSFAAVLIGLQLGRLR